MTTSSAPDPRRFDTVSFLTDYGTRDEFVGVVKAVIRDLAPQVTVIDLTHEIPPFDVRAGSLALARCIGYVPAGVVMAVVDPGVGTERRAVAVEVADGAGVLIGPDNGLLAPAVAMAGGAQRAVELTNPDYQLAAPGATFAGRDVFAPAAAHLCNGVPLTDFGPEIDPGLMLPATVPLPRQEDEELFAEVLWVDHYGNCQLNLGPEDVAALGSHVRVRIERPGHPDGPVTRYATIATSFAEIGMGIGLLLDSYGMMALSVDRRSAAEELSLGAGDQVVLRAAAGPEGSGGAGPVPVRLGR